MSRQPPRFDLYLLSLSVLPDCSVDIYHSYLGLATLAMMEEPEIKPLDPLLCISTQQRDRIHTLRKTALIQTRKYWKHGYAFCTREDNPENEKVESNK